MTDKKPHGKPTYVKVTKGAVVVSDTPFPDNVHIYTYVMPGKLTTPTITIDARLVNDESDTDE